MFGEAKRRSPCVFLTNNKDLYLLKLIQRSQVIIKFSGGRSKAQLDRALCSCIDIGKRFLSHAISFLTRSLAPVPIKKFGPWCFKQLANICQTEFDLGEISQMGNYRKLVVVCVAFPNYPGKWLIRSSTPTVTPALDRNLGTYSWCFAGCIPGGLLPVPPWSLHQFFISKLRRISLARLTPITPTIFPPFLIFPKGVPPLLARPSQGGWLHWLYLRTCICTLRQMSQY